MAKNPNKERGKDNIDKCSEKGKNDLYCGREEFKYVVSWI